MEVHIHKDREKMSLKGEKWDRFAQKRKWDGILRPSIKEKNELDKSHRNVRESHIHEERTIINSKEEESRKKEAQDREKSKAVFLF